ncbi:MAG: amidohydrolase family protein, partial [Candidatus Eisenbacteria bacterium]
PPTLDENREAILRAEKLAFSLGITTVHEIDAPSVAEAYRSLDREGRLRLRVCFFARAMPEDAARLRGTDEAGSFRFAGIKVFLDGSIGGRTAAVNEPYRGGGTGVLLLDVRTIRGLLRRAAASGTTIAFHAIGDRAIEALLGACEGVRASGTARFPHRIEHAEMLAGASIDRIRSLGLRLSMQPNFPLRWGGAGGMYEERLGPRRARALNRIRSAVRSGIPVAFGSDCMPLDPFYGLDGAVRHPVPEERLAWGDAFSRYTGTGERFAGPGGEGGALRAGRRADFTLFSRKTGWGEPIDRGELVRTIAAGETVYER